MSEEKNMEESSRSQLGSDKKRGSAQSSVGSQQLDKKTEQLEANQTTSNEQRETSTLKPETENMEVHKHPHHVMHKKKWGEYVLEFLMIFFAVFLGFIAENIRENTVERHREKDYIRSFIEDLKTDTSAITINIQTKKARIVSNDSLINYLYADDPGKHGNQIYFIARQLTRTNNFFATDRTIKQLQNAGGLRLIKNQKASDSIAAYDESVQRIYLTQIRQEDEFSDVKTLMGKVLDPMVLQTMVDGESIIPPRGNPRLRNADKELMIDFIYAIHQLKSSDALNLVRLQRLKRRAEGIIVFMKKEYHLE